MYWIRCRIKSECEVERMDRTGGKGIFVDGHVQLLLIQLVAPYLKNIVPAMLEMIPGQGRGDEVE